MSSPQHNLLEFGGPEAGEYNYRQDAHELRLFLANLQPDEVAAVRRGRAEFALVTRGDLILFCYRFRPAIPWSDAPYSWHLVPADQRTVPAVATPDKRDTLMVVLVEATTGIVQGLRVLSLSPEFTTTLHSAIRAQAERPWPGDEAYDRQLKALYREYPTTDQLVAAATARTVGGA